LRRCHLAGLVLAAAAGADDGRWPRSRCWPSGVLLRQGSLANAEQVFWLKYFLSSQSAILWMSMLFFMSTLFYWVGMFAHVARPQPWS
jgi:hypothetical protein